MTIRHANFECPTSYGVKQGCVLGPTLFSMMFSAMLIDVYKDTSYGVDLRYRFDGGGLFNQARLKAKTKVDSFSARDFLFADDCEKIVARRLARELEEKELLPPTLGSYRTGKDTWMNAAVLAADVWPTKVQG